jgi:hypothetical protein
MKLLFIVFLSLFLSNISMSQDSARNEDMWSELNHLINDYMDDRIEKSDSLFLEIKEKFDAFVLVDSSNYVAYGNMGVVCGREIERIKELPKIEQDQKKLDSLLNLAKKYTIIGMELLKEEMDNYSK